MAMITILRNNQLFQAFNCDLWGLLNMACKITMMMIEIILTIYMDYPYVLDYRLEIAADVCAVSHQLFLV